jgi:hypothetical protein
MVRAAWLVLPVLALAACSGAGTVTASAGADQTVAGGSSVTLDASGSKDSGGAALTYAWTQTAGPNVSLSGASSVRATFTAPTVTANEALTFTVTVTDGKSSAAASTTVTVTPGNGPVAVINAPASAQSGATVTLDGSGSHGGTGTLTLSWAQSTGPSVTLSSLSGATVTFTAPTVTAQTTLTFVLAAVDASGHLGRATANVSILPPGSGTPPTATANATPSGVQSGATVTLQGSGTDTNTGATITGYAWTQTAGMSATLSNAGVASPTFVAPTVTAMTTLTFSLIVTDSLGLQSSPATVNVTVSPIGANVPPTATPSANPSTVASGGTVTLQGSGTDPNTGATITGYAWSQTAGPTVTLSSTTTQSPTFTAPTVGSSTTLTFSLVVTDSLSLHSSAATTNVTVSSQSGSNIKYVFVIVEENIGANQIYQDPTDAPYIVNTLMAAYGWGTGYGDPVQNFPHVSEPHYIWMEAGTNALPDYTFTTDDDASSSNSTDSTAHLATQLNTAGISWTSYQEGLPAGCPITSSSSTNYAAKHDPFVFFQNISGNPPSTTTPSCTSHHKDFTALAGDLSAGTVSKFTFITPNLCDDMHGASCSNGCSTSGSSACIAAGDSWLQTNLPPIISFVNAHQGVIFLVWDEPESNPTQPFLVIGPNVIQGANSVALTHGSLLKSEEEIFGLPILPTVTSENDFSSFFNSGKFP